MSEVAGRIEKGKGQQLASIIELINRKTMTLNCNLPNYTNMVMVMV